MAALVNFSKVAAKLTNKTSLGAVVSVRNHWNKDFKPAPFPQTQKERDAAAKKYNVDPNKYEVYPDDGLGYGDYPKLKDESIELRDPYYPWDYPEHKRNFNEPLHAQHDLYSEDRYNSTKQRYTMPFMYATFLGIMTFCFSLYYWLEDKKMFRPVMPKQLPIQGKHYTYETK